MKTQNISAYPPLVKKRGGGTWPQWWLQYPCDLLMIPPFEDRYNIYNKVAYHVITLHFLDGFEVIKLFLLDIAMFAKHEKILIFPVFSHTKDKQSHVTIQWLEGHQNYSFLFSAPHFCIKCFSVQVVKIKTAPLTYHSISGGFNHVLTPLLWCYEPLLSLYPQIINPLIFVTKM